MKRAAVYTRVSSVDQHPETQLLDLRQMAAQRGYEIVQEYVDRISGAKPIARKLGLPSTIDFRSFRTMHASLIRRTGARAEVTRDNMGHSDTGTTLNVYSETWWDERVDAVSRAIEAVFKEPAAKPSQSAQSSRNATKQPVEWVPFWVPQPTAQLVGD